MVLKFKCYGVYRGKQRYFSNFLIRELDLPEIDLAESLDINIKISLYPAFRAPPMESTVCQRQVLAWPIFAPLHGAGSPPPVLPFYTEPGKIQETEIHPADVSLPHGCNYRLVPQSRHICEEQ